MKFNCIYKALVLSFLVSSSFAFAEKTGRLQCSSYYGGTMLVFRNIFTSKNIAIAFVGNGVKAYKWGEYKISRKVKGDCSYCYNFYTDEVWQNNHRVKIKVETRQNAQGNALMANVYTKSKGKKWSYWHSGLRCLVWK